MILSLCFHSIDERPNKFYDHDFLNMSVKNFDSLITNLKKNKSINFINTSLSNIEKGKINILITFDDGLKNFKYNAYPVLKKNNIPTILFINGFASSNNLSLNILSEYIKLNQIKFNQNLADFNKVEFISIKKELITNKIFDDYMNYQGNFLNKNDLFEFDNDNNIKIANHSYFHLNYKSYSKTELIKDLNLNVSFLDKFISFDKYFFAYPYGQIFYNYDKKTDQFLLNQNLTKVFYANVETLSNQKVSNSRLVVKNSDNTLSKLLISYVIDFSKCKIKKILRYFF